MRVCIDASAAVQGRGGIGRYTARLAQALAARPDVELALLYHAPGGARPPATLGALPAQHMAMSSKPWRASLAASQLLHLPLDRYVGASDIFHATDHLLPFLRYTPAVFTVHDLAFLAHPETHLRSNRLFLQAMMPRFVRAATAVIADSEATRRDVLRHYQVDSAKVHTVPLGVEPTFTPVDPAAARALARERYALGTPYVLFVGTLEPRKNVRGLLAAYQELLRRRADPPLLAIAGGEGRWFDDVYQLVRAQGLEARVRFLGRVADADLPALYSAASAFAYPSLYEGFGLPPLEALACGTPVVCSNRSSLPEVVGDAALQIDPTDVGALADALERLLDDEALRRDLRHRGLMRAAGFTWQATANATVQVYMEAMRQARRRGRR